jgi:type I restriction enzyme S subunit
MSLPRYPEYKDSGVEWLGEVPGHWEVKRLKQACHVFPSNVDKKSHDGETPVNLCNYTDVYYNETITADMEFMAATASTDQIAKFTLRAGDTIITKDSETADDIAIGAYVPADLPGVICGYHLSMIRPMADTNGAFVKRLFDSTYVRSCVAVRANGLTRVGLGQYEIDNLELPFPPPDEQQTIATFLDRETGKIDALIAEQRRLVELLAEKRQAVISHAVTKGLPSTGSGLNVKMKDSGIEWLGDVPEHWNVVPLGHLATQIQTGPFGSQLHAEDYVEGETPVINPSNIQDGKLVADWSCTVTQEIVARLSQHKLMIGDIVFARRGEMGRCAMVTSDEVNWLCGTGSLNVRLSDRAIPVFISIYLRTAYVRELLKLESVGSTMDNLNTQILSGVSVPLPPLAEQQTIAAFLDTETAKLDTLTAEANRAIALLQVRRSALISAAVTGKIDVRGRA